MRSRDGHARVLAGEFNAHPRLLSEFEAYLERKGFSQRSVRVFRGAARHFLVWLELENIDLAAVNATTLRRFRDHYCACPPPKMSGGHYKSGPSRSRQFIHGPIRFVQFLECSGRTTHPNELEFGLELLDQFLRQRQSQGFSSRSIEDGETAIRHFLTWLHQSRIPMAETTEATLRWFTEHDCLCPGQFKGIGATPRAGSQIGAVRQFREYLANQGLAPTVPTTTKKRFPDELKSFRSWLQQHRGIGESSISEHLRLAGELRQELGELPEHYDAATVRDVLLHFFTGASKSRARRLTIAMRMYLRFLSSNGLCRPGLEGAVPSCPKWRLSELPRYIPTADIERIIESCDPCSAVGIRDKAILLLLARLALRGGDVICLRLRDIDWKNAKLRVCGKGNRTVELPLPQDVGDAMLEYLTRARPKVPNEESVFLTDKAPHRRFASSAAISKLVTRALGRAGVQHSVGGAHLIRHSVATGLLRSGASLEVVGTLLRHRSWNTTSLYAKVDVPMLQQVAQPWIGNVQ